MNCVRCAIPLRAWRVGSNEIDLCYKCGGAFYEQGEIGIPMLMKNLKPADCECPRCGLRMSVGHYGEKGGPELDYCSTCGGVWADKGELEKISPSGSFAGASAASAAAAAFTGRTTAPHSKIRVVPPPAQGVVAPQGKAAHKPPPYGPWTEHWDEFLLYNPEKGFAWLIEEDGHYTLDKTTTVRPQGLTSLTPQKTRVRFGEETMQVYDRGKAVLDEAEGETPWIAKPGDRFEATELIAPPRMVTVEKSKGEVEHFVGDYLEPEEVWDGFKLSGAPRRRSWVHAAQPFVETDFNRQSKGWTGLFALAFGALLLGAATAGAGRESLALKQSVHPQFPTAFLSEPFKIDKPKTICRLETHSNLNNQWYWLGFEIIDENGQWAGELSQQLEYYHGRDSEGAWSEGSNRDKSLFVVEDPGTYRLRIVGEGGTGSGSTAFNHPFHVSVVAGHVPLRFFLFGFVFCAFVAGWMFDKKWAFERKRWGEVMEDDDDDD